MTSEREIVALSTYGRGAGSTRVRLLDWFRHLGLAPTVLSYVGSSDNKFRTLVRQWPSVLAAERQLRLLPERVGNSTLLLSRQASPFSSGGLEEKLLGAAAHSVYDFDDALFHDTRGLTRRLWSKKRVWERSVTAADVVIAGSSMLAHEASKFSANVRMIPSCIEPGHYVTKQSYDLSETPRAVWIGSNATEKFLGLVTEPLLRLNRRYGLRVSVISGGRASLGALDEIVDRQPWTLESFARNLSTADFGIMPLPDTPFTRGKCAYKILQYAATALPVIGSPVGANTEVIDRLNAVSASTDDEWFEAAAGLIEMTGDQRRRMGSTGQRQVVRHYSFRSWRDEWLSALGRRSGEA